MKVSKREYRDKQNQATGSLLVAILAFLMLTYRVYKILFQADVVEWNMIVWGLMCLGSIALWKWRERRLNELTIDEEA